MTLDERIQDRKRYSQLQYRAPNIRHRSNQFRGDWYENFVALELRLQGFVVIRSTVSKGPADLVAVRKDVVKFIQCKTGEKFLKRETCQELEGLEVPPGCVKELWVAETIQIPGDTKSGFQHAIANRIFRID